MTQKKRNLIREEKYRDGDIQIPAEELIRLIKKYNVKALNVRSTSKYDNGDEEMMLKIKL